MKFGSLSQIYSEFKKSESGYLKPSIQKILKKIEVKKIIKNINPKGKHPRIPSSTRQNLK